MNRKVFIAICVIYSLVNFMGCEGITDLSGRITDPQNSPIKGAKVVLKQVDAVYSVSSEDLSNDKGDYEVMLTHAPGGGFVLDFKVSKEGYITHNQKIKPGTTDNSLNVTLKPEE